MTLLSHRASFALLSLVAPMFCQQQPERVSVADSIKPISALIASRQTDYVKVSITSSLGPMGYLQMPSGLTQVPGADSNLQAINKNYKFPSIYVYISASPLLVPVLSNDADIDSIKSVQDADRDISWMDATFELTIKNAAGADLPCEDNVQIIGLLPGLTIASAKTPVANTAANAANQLMTALAPFFPGVKGVAEASTSALSVLFNDLFPPKSAAFQYAFMESACKFGWYFKPNPGATPPTSVLGTQTGIVLLRTTKDVTSVTMSGHVLSSWNHPPTASSRQYSYVNKETTLKIPDVQSTVDFNSLQDLSLFPLLVSTDQAKMILHINSDEDWQSLTKPKSGTGVLQTTPDGKFVIKASLQQYLQPASKSAN